MDYIEDIYFLTHMLNSRCKVNIYTSEATSTNVCAGHKNLGRPPVHHWLWWFSELSVDLA